MFKVILSVISFSNIHASHKIFYLQNIDEKQGMYIKAIMSLVEVVLEGTSFTVVDVKRSPLTKKLVIHIDDRHSKQLSMLKPNKVGCLPYFQMLYIQY